LHILVSLILPSIFLFAFFFLGRYLIRKPQAATRLFTLGMRPESKFGLRWFRFTGYLFCFVAGDSDSSPLSI
jgi:hypothetical protein